jgi:NACHT conflict system protein
MSVEAAALGAGESVAASAELVDLIKTGFPDEIMRRKTENQFEALAISVAERLQPYIRRELRGLDDGTREAALHDTAWLINGPGSQTPPGRL